MNDWVNNREAGDLRRHHAHYDVTVMKQLLYSKVYPKDINFLSYIQGNQAILKCDKRMIITSTM